MLTQALPMWKLYLHGPVMVFLFCFGSCVGSFLNVVIYRLPAGMSVITPPSRCPTCGAKLRFFRENLPIIGWLLVRGRCRYCGVRISPQYMVIELLVALMFIGLYVLLYVVNPSTNWWGGIGGHMGGWWYYNGVFRTWPAYIAVAFMLSGLLAMTIIDARTFTIPIEIPLFVTVTAFIAWPLQALMPLLPSSRDEWAYPGVGWTGALLSIGAMAGVVIATALLRRGIFKPSFADYGEYIAPPPPGDPPPPNERENRGDEPGAAAESDCPCPDASLDASRLSASEAFFLLPALLGLAMAGFGWMVAVSVAMGSIIIAAILWKVSGRTIGPAAAAIGGASPDAAEQVLAPEYPHARREMKVEIGFLLPCLIGMAVGGFIGWQVAGGWGAAWGAGGSVPPVLVQVIGGSFAGYLMGGGLVWAMRILGTLAFGREAMGLGDVHLMGAVGAVVGWFDPILIFFIAPFSGLLWAVVGIGLAAMFRQVRRELPYGPHLAVATLVVILCRPGLQQLWARFMPGVPWPASKLVTPPAAPVTGGFGPTAPIGPSVPAPPPGP